VLDAVDTLDELCTGLNDPEGLRDDLLRLHGIVHALVNGANCAATTRDVSVVEQIEGVLDQIDHYVAGLLSIRDVLRPLEALRHEDLAGPDHD
jgi:hypothetical protein